MSAAEEQPVEQFDRVVKWGKRYLLSLGLLTPVTVVLLTLIWIWLPLLPEGSGVSFGLWFRVFFTWILFVAVAFFWLLQQDRIPAPGGPWRVLGVVTAVYSGTVALLVGGATVLPHFEGRPPEVAALSLTAVGRGDVLFHSASPGCFLCHTIDGSGGTRAPNLTVVAERAGARVAGLAADQYLREKIKAGMTYQYTVPEYSPIMPVFGSILTDEQIDDLIAFLLAPPDER